MKKSSPSTSGGTFRLTVLSLAIAGFTVSTLAQPVAPKAAEPATAAAQKAMATTLPFADTADFDEANRGFVGTLTDAHIVVEGRPMPVWSGKPYAFIKGEAPATVNPSLWRQAQLNNIHGLFKVTDGVYQVRGFDLSNMTIVEGKTGLIIIDPLTAKETAKAALDLYYAHRPKKPVHTVIYSHGHADHYGGVKGVTSEADVKAKKTHILAPSGFMETAVAENIIAGNAMSRRSQFQFGPLIPPGPNGQVDAGLGKNLPRGSITLIAPTDTITKTTEERTIDGVDVVFQLVPGSEAPSEMLMYFPKQRVLNMAEDATHNMHNLYTIRGAEVRDGNLWAKYIDNALLTFGDKSDIMIAQHQWPTFGQDRVTNMLKKQRDMYKYINDQSLRLLNHGYTPLEIAETLRMPASQEKEWSSRGYYGTLSHNAKSVYQKYLGWYDANPANLNPLPPAEAGKKYVEYMGGADALLQRSRADFSKGEYRWVATAMNHLVFADPTNRAARELGADALEQLGYQAEAGTWRNAYLYGAQELRNGIMKLPSISSLNPDTLKAVTLELFFDFMGVQINGPKAEGKTLVLNWNFTDVKQQFVLNLENSALTYQTDKQSPKADATVTLTRETMDLITLKQLSFPDALKGGQVKVEGNPAKLIELLRMLDNFNPMFEVVEPKAAAAQ